MRKTFADTITREELYNKYIVEKLSQIYVHIKNSHNFIESLKKAIS